MVNTLMSRTFRYRKVAPHAVQVVDRKRIFHFHKKAPLWRFLCDTQFGHIFRHNLCGKVGKYYRSVQERRHRRFMTALIHAGYDERIMRTYKLQSWGRK